jgi:hypothetical protein
LGCSRLATLRLSGGRQSGKKAVCRPAVEGTARLVRSHEKCVAIRQGETINEAALVAMFKAIVANNRAGG